VCLVTDGAPVLDGVDKRQLEALMTHPLALLLDRALIGAVRARLDHLIGLDAVRTLAARADIVSPITRRPVVAVLAFGRERDHVRATNYALARILFGTKLVGVPELWLAALYFIVHDEVAYLRDQPAFMSAFRDHLTHRMRMHTTNMTLTGLPIEPMVKAPVDVAVWYCAISPFMWESNAARDAECNRLRAFGPTARFLLRILDELFPDYAYERPVIVHWCALYRAFAWMMHAAKQQTPQPQAWRTLLRAQVQNSTRLSDGTTIVLLDGPASDATRPPLPPALADPALTFAELWTLATQYVDVRNATGAVFIPRTLACVDAPVAVYNYAYPRGMTTTDAYVPTLSPATFRPVYVDREERRPWGECFKERYGSNDMRQYLSMYKYFIDCTHDWHRYPTRDMYVAYVARKQAARWESPKETLPEAMAALVDQLFANYVRVLGAGFAQVPVRDFMNKTGSSTAIAERTALDGSAAFLV
jgi:hypothetical protein